MGVMTLRPSLSPNGIHFFRAYVAVRLKKNGKILKLKLVLVTTLAVEWVARLHSPEVQDSADGGSRYKLPEPDYATYVFVSLGSTIFSLQINLF